MGELSESTLKELDKECLAYLRFRKFTSAAQKLHTAIAPKEGALNRANRVKQLWTHFDNAVPEFFHQLPELVPKSRYARATSLQLELRVYCAIAPMHPHSKLFARLKPAARVSELHTSMEGFKQYLELREAAVDKDSMLYYGLPYTPKPHTHTSFKHLFTESWLTQLRKRLTRFISVPISKAPRPPSPKPSTPANPTLLALYERYKDSGSVDLSNSPPPRLIRKAMAQAENEVKRERLARRISAKLVTDQQRCLRSLFKCCVEIFKFAEKLYKSANPHSQNEKQLHKFREQLTFCNRQIHELEQVSSTSDQGSSGTESWKEEDELPVLLTADTPANKNRLHERSESRGVRLDIDNVRMHSLTTPGTDGVHQLPPLPSLDRERPSTTPGTKSRRGLTSPEMSSRSPSMSPHSGYRPPHTSGLNYYQITQDLMSFNGFRKCCLLQALRWWITTQPSPTLRRKSLADILEADVLQCTRAATQMARSSSTAETMQKIHRAHQERTDLLTLLLRSDDDMVRDCTARMINAIASYGIARQYLLQHPIVIALIKEFLELERKDTNARQHALGALQKFSLHRVPQTEMIRMGVMRTVVELMRDWESLSDYSMEYGAALFMNLSLRTGGKIWCENNDRDLNVLGLLNHLLEHHNPNVRTYVNGALYSVLSRRKIRESAREMGLEAIISEFITNSEPQFKRQLECILEQLMDEDDDDNKEEDGEISDDEEGDGYEDDDGDDTDDDEEDELASMAKLRSIGNHLGIVRGPEMLIANYGTVPTPMLKEPSPRIGSSSNHNPHSNHPSAPQTTPTPQSHSPRESPRDKWTPLRATPSSRSKGTAGGRPRSRGNLKDLRQKQQEARTQHEQSIEILTNYHGQEGGRERQDPPTPFQGKTRLARSPPTGLGPGLKLKEQQKQAQAEAQDPAYGELFGHGLERVPPPKVLESSNLDEASLSQYYKAFASRARLGRTPAHGPAYVQNDEWPSPFNL